MGSFLIPIGAVLILVNSVLALKCYQCDSSKGISCGYGILSFTYPSIDCSAQSDSASSILSSIVPHKCVKLVAEDKNGNEYIARGCYPSTGPINTCNIIAKAMQFADSKDLNKLDCFQCDTDNCNSAPKIAGLSLVGLILACLVFIF